MKRRKKATKRIPRRMRGFLENEDYIFFCATDKKSFPAIFPVKFLFEQPSQLVFRYSELNETIELQKNQGISLSIDRMHPTDPMKNTGITVEATIEEKHSSKFWEGFNKKYSNPNEIIPNGEELGYVSARILKVVLWRGTFFSRWEPDKA